MLEMCHPQARSGPLGAISVLTCGNLEVCHPEVEMCPPVVSPSKMRPDLRKHFNIRDVSPSSRVAGSGDARIAVAFGARARVTDLGDRGGHISVRGGHISDVRPSRDRDAISLFSRVSYTERIQYSAHQSQCVEIPGANRSVPRSRVTGGHISSVRTSSTPLLDAALALTTDSTDAEVAMTDGDKQLFESYVPQKVPTRPDDLFTDDPPPIRRPARRKTAAKKQRTGPIILQGEPSGVREIKPIETRYAGCRFRSRLEARWAVWFDHLGIEWLYEPESYMIGPAERRRGYLPDFHLPHDEIWVEVKGSEASLDFQMLCDAAHPEHGLPLNLEEQVLPAHWPALQVRLVTLGPVPAGPGFHAAIGTIARQQMVRQLVIPFCELSVFDVPGRANEQHRHEIVPVYYPVEVDVDRMSGHPLPPPSGMLSAFGYGLPCPQIAGAYRAARSARFEHGESG